MDPPAFRKARLKSLQEHEIAQEVLVSKKKVDDDLDDLEK